MSELTYLAGTWPEPIVPPGEPSELYYEVDRATDNVLRLVHKFRDGTFRRGSIEIEERSGTPCPSLIEEPASQAFEHAGLVEISEAEFESLWSQGVDTPFW